MSSGSKVGVNRSDPWRIEAARRLRREATAAERQLWRELRQWPEAHWRRQRLIGDFIVDFYSDKAKLVVELDGGQHFEADPARSDRERDETLAKRGILVQRFDDATVLTRTTEVLEEIWRTWSARVGERKGKRSR